MGGDDNEEPVVGACRKIQGRGDDQSVQTEKEHMGVASSPLRRNSELGGWGCLAGEGRSPAGRVSRDDP